MKKGIIWVWMVIVVLASCKDDDINLFDKTADERVAEAIAGLKSELVSAPQGWKLKYRPEATSGSYNVLMTFDDDGNVRIRTDLGANDGEFFDQTITYRIDSSLGLELIMESYCFFSYLFEQDQASFGAEYEFNYRRKNDDGDLIFESKTDGFDPTVLVFEEASSTDQTTLLGIDLSEKLNEVASDLENFTPSFKLTYDDRDVVFYLSLDEFRRTINFKSASRKNNTQFTVVNFTTPYVIRGDSIVFDTPLVRTLLSNTITIQRIYFEDLSNTTLNICPSPMNAHSLEGVTSANDDVHLESSLYDANGGRFPLVSDFFVAPSELVFIDGFSAFEQIQQDVKGALAMQLYYDNDGFFALGFVIQNTDGSITFALREFTPVLVNNKVTFNFEPDISIFGNPQTDANVNNINIYLNLLTSGNNTYVFEYSPEIYEFHNPCTGISIAFRPIL